MILNMSNVGNQVIYKDSISVSSNTPTLVISGIQIPGGIVKGFALIRYSSDTLTNQNRIVSVYADQNKASENYCYFYYYEDGYFSTGSFMPFVYDSSAQTLTLAPNAVEPYFYGNYRLLIW